MGIYLEILAETIKGFNGLTIQSTINDSAYYDSEKDDKESDPNSNPKVGTHTTNVKSPHKLFINWLTPEITPVAIPPIEQTIAEDYSGSGDTFQSCRTILLKDIVTYAARSGMHVLRNPKDASRHGTDGITQWNGKTAIGSTRLTSPVQICGSTTGSPSRTGIQDIINPRGTIGLQWVRDAQPLDTFINVIYSKHRDPATTWSKVNGHKFTDEYSTNVNLCCQMNFRSDAVLSESTNFVSLGLASVHTSDELRSVFIPTIIIEAPTDVPNWLPTSLIIGEVKVDRVIRTGSEKD